MSDKTVETRITADETQAVRAWDRFGDKAAAVSARVTGAMGGMATMGETVRSSLGGMLGILTGSVVAAAIKNQLDLADTIGETAEMAGVTAEQFSTMDYASNLVGVSTETLSKAMVKLNSLLIDAQGGAKGANEMFQRLGLDPKKVKDSDQLLVELADRFSRMQNSAEKTALAVDIFGERMGPALIPFLNQGREGIAALREEAERLGFVVSTEVGNAAGQFNDTLFTLGGTVRGVVRSISLEMLPTLQQMASGMNTVLQQMLAINRAGGFFASISKQFQAERAGDDLARVVRQIELLQANIDRQGSDGVLDKRMRALRAEAAALSKEVAETSSWLKAFGAQVAPGAAVPQAGAGAAAPAGPWAPLPKPPADSGAGAAAGRGAAPRQPAAPAEVAAPTSFMQYYEAVLTQEREAAAQRDALREFSKEQELTYWQGIQATALLTSRDQVAISSRTSRLQVEILREKARQAQELGAVELQAWQARNLAMIDSEQAVARQQLALGAITQEQLLQQEAAFEQRRQQIKLAALQVQLTQLDPDRDPVRIAQLQAEIEQLEAQHQQRLQDLRNQGAVQARDREKEFAGSLEQGYAGVLARVGTSIRSFSDLVRGMFTATVQAFVGLLAKMAAEWIVKKVLMKGISKVFALGEIATEAAKAGAGGVASMAAAPFPLNLSAPAFGAGMAAAAMAYAPLASAAGGYDIPAGLNPMVQTHAREMILPATLSDTVRDMAQVYASGGGGGAAAQAPVLRTVPMPGDFWLVHRHDLMRAVDRSRKDKLR